MNIFVDENIPAITVNTLRELGHKVEDIRGTPDEGIPDEQVWELTQKKKCLLITTDKGFSQYRNESHNGILIVRLKKPTKNAFIKESCAPSNSSKTESGVAGL